MSRPVTALQYKTSNKRAAIATDSEKVASQASRAKLHADESATIFVRGTKFTQRLGGQG